MENVIYDGFFLRFPIEGKLEKTVVNQHCTLGFKNGYIPEALGEEVVLYATAYGNDGTNEGLRVESIVCKNKELKERFAALEVPHVTLSVSANSKPVNTAKLAFNKPARVTMAAFYGVFTPEGVVTSTEFI